MTDRDDADPSRPLELAPIRSRAIKRDPLTLPQAMQLERDRDDLLAIADRLVADKAALAAALAPLAKIADAYEANALDDEARRFWGSNNENENESPFSEITLYSGRGGAGLLTLADCFKARDALRNIPPAAPADAAQPPRRANPRDLKSDLDYLEHADAHADEGPLGEAATRSILKIANYWVNNLREEVESTRSALRYSFPELSAIRGRIAGETIERVGAEHVKMLMSCRMLPTELVFLDSGGRRGKITHTSENDSWIEGCWSFDGVIWTGDDASNKPADLRAETVSVLEAAFGEYACMLLPKFNQKEHDEFERNFAVPARALLRALRVELWEEREAKS